MMSAVNDAIDVLLDIERRSRASARGLPEQVEVKTTWAGVGFRVGEARLVAPLGIIREILTFPLITRVPGAKQWMRGVANVRGTLLPITDLNCFLQGEPTPVRRQTRVLVIDNGAMGAGLLVNEVLGLRHFFQEEFSSDTGLMTDFVRRFVSGVYRQSNENWGSVDLHAIIESEDFMHVAA